MQTSDGRRKDLAIWEEAELIWLAMRRLQGWYDTPLPRSRTDFYDLAEQKIKERDVPDTDGEALGV